MKIELVLLGKTKDAYLEAGIKEFIARLNHYTTATLRQIKTRKVAKQSNQRILEQESELLEAAISPGAFRVVLDRTGRQVSSEELAEKIEQLELRGVKVATFIIGGPLGLAPQQLQQADFIMSLSKMTFTHDMCRLLLLEQLYRAYTIKAGEKYHK